MYQHYIKLLEFVNKYEKRDGGVSSSGNSGKEIEKWVERIKDLLKEMNISKDSRGHKFLEIIGESRSDLPRSNLPRNDLPRSNLPRSDLPKSDLPRRSRRDVSEKPRRGYSKDTEDNTDDGDGKEDNYALSKRRSRQCHPKSFNIISNCWSLLRNTKKRKK